METGYTSGQVSPLSEQPSTTEGAPAAHVPGGPGAGTEDDSSGRTVTQVSAVRPVDPLATGTVMGRVVRGVLFGVAPVACSSWEGSSIRL